MVIFTPEPEEESAIISVVFPHIVMLTFTLVLNRGLSIIDFKDLSNIFKHHIKGGLPSRIMAAVLQLQGSRIFAPTSALKPQLF